MGILLSLAVFVGPVLRFLCHGTLPSGILHRPICRDPQPDLEFVVVVSASKFPNLWYSMIDLYLSRLVVFPLRRFELAGWETRWKQVQRACMCSFVTVMLFGFCAEALWRCCCSLDFVSVLARAACVCWTARSKRGRRLLAGAAAEIGKSQRTGMVAE